MQISQWTLRFAVNLYNSLLKYNFTDVGLIKRFKKMGGHIQTNNFQFAFDHKREQKYACSISVDSFSNSSLHTIDNVKK